MKRKAKDRLTPAEQSARFIEAAKAVQNDESERRFEDAMKTITSKRIPPKKTRKT